MSNSNGDPVNGSPTRYYPFGDWRTEPTANLTDRGYTGHQHNNTISNDLGLIYMNARYYLPGTGRFASADTVTPDPANPQAFNRYSYTYNNPLAYTDPDGHDPYWCSGSQCMQNYNSSMANAGGTTNLKWLATLYPSSMAIFTPPSTSVSPDCPVMAIVCNPSPKALFELGVDSAFETYQVASELIERGLSGELQQDFFAAPAGTIANSLPGAMAIVGMADVLASPYFAARNLLSPCSFSADTSVSTIDGLQPIGQLETGTLVLAYGETTNTTGYYPLLAVLVHEDPIILFLTIDGEVVETTPDHPFYTEQGWVEAGELWVGAAVYTAGGDYGHVQALQLAPIPQPMYDLTVATTHTFFVGVGQWLVHNCNFPDNSSQVNHIFRDAEGHLAEDTFENRQLLLSTVLPENAIRTDQFGNDWYARVLDDGTEAWVSVRNNIIQNGGVNQVPRHIMR